MNHGQAVACAFLGVLNTWHLLGTWDWPIGLPGIPSVKLSNDTARAAYLRLCDRAEGRRVQRWH